MHSGSPAPSSRGSSTHGRPIRIMVVEDSVVIRGLMIRILERNPRIQIVASVGNGQLAVESLRRKPVDVIILDIEMPVMDGLTALPKLLEVAPAVKIIIASTLSTRNADISIRCLDAGAADYVPKPTAARDISSGENGGQAFARELLDKVLTLGSLALKGRKWDPAVDNARPVPQVPPPERRPIKLRPAGTAKPQILAIGCSTGGPQALRTFLSDLGPSFPLPIVITQHMPPTFTAILAQHITAQSRRTCVEARDDQPLTATQTYLAPGNFHMRLQRRGQGVVLKLSQDPPQNFCRPAVDPLFQSVADSFAARSLAVVLTGMGQDGLRGARAIVAAGGTVIAQDEKSSVVWGMPGAVATAGLCSVVAPITDLAGQVKALLEGTAR